MNWEGCGKKWPWSTAWRSPGINLERITKTMKNYRYKNLYGDGDFKRELAGMLHPLECHIHRQSVQFK
jgi:hypothetical protein